MISKRNWTETIISCELTQTRIINIEVNCNRSLARKEDREEKAPKPTRQIHDDGGRRKEGVKERKEKKKKRGDFKRKSKTVAPSKREK